MFTSESARDKVKALDVSPEQRGPSGTWGGKAEMGPLQRPPRDPCEQAHGPGGGRWWRSLSSGWHVHLAPALSPPGQWESPSHKPWMRPRPVGGGACGLTRGVLSHEWVSPDFAAGDAGPVCSVLEAAGTPSARTSTVLMSTSTPVLLGKPWLLPVISDPEIGRAHV